MLESLLVLVGMSETIGFANAAPCEIHTCLCPGQGQGLEANFATLPPGQAVGATGESWILRLSFKVLARKSGPCY